MTTADGPGLVLRGVMGLVLRSLGLLCSLSLALPQGWCCYLPRLAPAPCPGCGATGPHRAAARGCCCGGEGQRASETDHDHGPAPRTPCVRCCCRTDLSGAPGATPFSPDLGIVAPVLPPAPSACDSGPVAAVAGAAHSLSPPLHLLHCVWLC